MPHAACMFNLAYQIWYATRVCYEMHIRPIQPNTCAISATSTPKASQSPKPWRPVWARLAWRLRHLEDALSFNSISDSTKSEWYHDKLVNPLWKPGQIIWASVEFWRQKSLLKDSYIWAVQSKQHFADLSIKCRWCRCPVYALQAQTGNPDCYEFFWGMPSRESKTYEMILKPAIEAAYLGLPSRVKARYDQLLQYPVDTRGMNFKIQLCQTRISKSQ